MRGLFSLLRWSLIALRRRAYVARREHRGARFLLYSAIAGLGEALAIATSLALLLAVLAIGAIDAAFGVAFLAIVLVVPGPLAQHVAVPLGYHRLAYWLVVVDELGRSGSDRPARLAAARAAARRGSPADAAAWLATRRGTRLDATEVAVQAILAHGRGDRGDARALFESIAAFADPAPEAREVAAEWLALDDAARGAWADLVARSTARARPARGAHRRPSAIRNDAVAGGGEALWPATSLTFLLEGVALRLLGDARAPSVPGLWLRWLEAPSRRATWGLVRRAAATPEADPRAAGASAAASATSTGAAASPGDVAAPAEELRPAMAAALSAHARALADGTVDAVAAAAAAWDAAITTRGLAIAVARRAIELGAAPDAGDRALVTLDEQIAAELARVIDEQRLPLTDLAARAPGSQVLAGIARRARRELLARLELTCDRIGDRAHEHRAIDAIDELRTFVAVRRAYDEAVRQGGPELERLAFPHVHAELIDWTVWLWNERKEYFLSHLITVWLFERALAVGDSEAIELHGSNGAIAIPG